MHPQRAIQVSFSGHQPKHARAALNPKSMSSTSSEEKEPALLLVRMLLFVASVLLLLAPTAALVPGAEEAAMELFSFSGAFCATAGGEISKQNVFDAIKWPFEVTFVIKNRYLMNDNR